MGNGQAIVLPHFYPGEEGPAVLKTPASFHKKLRIGRETVKGTQTCASASLSLRSGCCQMSHHPFGGCFPTGWAEATKNVSGAAWAADPPSFTALLPWHRSRPRVWDFCGFPASQSFCLQGAGGLCHACFLHLLLPPFPPPPF